MAIFPSQLVSWSGNQSGGVRRFFDEKSGRPSGQVIQTGLLDRLHGWAISIARRQPGIPSAVLLVGGPGNGKTEAIESTITVLDQAIGVDGLLMDRLRDSYLPPHGMPVPRVARASVEHGQAAGGKFAISVVQDASTVAGSHGKTAAQLLLEELEGLGKSESGDIYLCCVNRGILDDALIEAIDNERTDVRNIIEAITASISVSAEAPSCWPLDGFPDIAVWPMDAESLLLPAGQGGVSPAKVVLDRALDSESWSPRGKCVAGTGCPFCGSQAILAHDKESNSLLSIMRWHEVGEGKRWSFRDLFSLTSYLLAGNRGSMGDSPISPCEWAATLLYLDEKVQQGEMPRIKNSTAIFHLVAARYQHALFHHWDAEQSRPLRKAINDLGLKQDNTAMGLLWFLESRKKPYLPTMIADPLERLSNLLDPAMTDPNHVVHVGSKVEFPLRDMDTGFSRSVREGIEFLDQFMTLSAPEMDLLSRLASLDDHLSEPLTRRSRPAVATSLQRFVRDFSCRLARRSIGCRLAAVPDREVLEEFRNVLEDDQHHGLYDVSREVEQLLNNDRDFEISLTTTFGQPLPPEGMRATLVVQSQRVEPFGLQVEGRPRQPMSFLRFGDGQSTQPIALTYHLFKAMKELERGMSPASLHEGVLALLDTAKARLAGPIVRDARLLERAYIKIGNSQTVVTQMRGSFEASRGGSS